MTPFLQDREGMKKRDRIDEAQQPHVGRWRNHRCAARSPGYGWGWRSETASTKHSSPMWDDDAIINVQRVLQDWEGMKKRDRIDNSTAAPCGTMTPSSMCSAFFRIGDGDVGWRSGSTVLKPDRYLYLFSLCWYLVMRSLTAFTPLSTHDTYKCRLSNAAWYVWVPRDTAFSISLQPGYTPSAECRRVLRVDYMQALLV